MSAHFPLIFPNHVTYQYIIISLETRKVLLLHFCSLLLQKKPMQKWQRNPKLKIIVIIA